MLVNQARKYPQFNVDSQVHIVYIDIGKVASILSCTCRRRGLAAGYKSNFAVVTRYNPERRRGCYAGETLKYRSLFGWYNKPLRVYKYPLIKNWA